MYDASLTVVGMVYVAKGPNRPERWVYALRPGVLPYRALTRFIASPWRAVGKNCSSLEACRWVIALRLPYLRYRCTGNLLAASRSCSKLRSIPVCGETPRPHTDPWVYPRSRGISPIRAAQTGGGRFAVVVNILVSSLGYRFIFFSSWSLRHRAG